MDCDMVSSLQWDWENLIMPNRSNSEADKMQQISTEWEIENGEGIESIFPCFAGHEGISSVSSHTALLKSSQSKSTNSSSPKVKHRKVALERPPGYSCSNLDSVQVKHPQLSGNNNDNSAGQSMQVSICQIDGCDLDLSSAKDYHRKHRVCENHSKCPKVIVGGLERRFCQQCSRFHAMSEFDENKRSCRKRLSHHNARRRRKPRGVFPLNSERMYDQRQHANMLWNGLSLNTKCEEKYGWGTTTYDTEPTQTESGFTLSFERGNGSEEQLYGSSSPSFSAFQTSGMFSETKSKFQLHGSGDYKGVVHESQDFDRALSLLSTSSDPMVQIQPHGHPLSLLCSYDNVLR
ncbi:unnamed protein product [Cochlearia groenlandica]